MDNKIGVIDIGSYGNILSISRALEFAGGKVQVINSPREIFKCSKLILPGVGAFNPTMKILRDGGWISHIKDFALKNPILGICLGMQIMAEIGYEFGESCGLKLIKGEVKKLVCKESVPHIGFNKIEKIKNSVLLNGLEREKFYFMHSYELINYTDIVALCNYGNHEFLCAIEKGNIFGVQFHPEKSKSQGINLLKNFINI